MKYILTTSELTVLGIVWATKTRCSGYAITKTIADRGMATWANVRQTSVYGALNSLKRRGLISSKLDEKKKGKGPNEVVWKPTKKGGLLLYSELSKRLECAREFTIDLKLALSFWELVSKEHRSKCLLLRFERQKNLLNELVTKSDKVESETCSISASKVFRYTILGIKSDLEWTKKTITDLEKEEN